MLELLLRDPRHNEDVPNWHVTGSQHWPVYETAGSNGSVTQYPLFFGAAHALLIPKQDVIAANKPTPNCFSTARRVTDWAMLLVSSSNWLFIFCRSVPFSPSTDVPEGTDSIFQESEIYLHSA